MVDSLDQLVTLMQTELAKANKDVSRWTCWGCKKGIEDSRLEIMNHNWHSNCFKCTNCKCDLPYSFYNDQSAPISILSYSSARKKVAREFGDNPYCEDCFATICSNKCDYCLQTITEKSFSALGKSFHPEHFLCSKCGKNLAADKYFLRNTKIVCTNCKY